LSYVTEDGRLVEFNGKIEITVGGYQPDEPNKSSSGLVKKNSLIN